VQHRVERLVKRTLLSPSGDLAARIAGATANGWEIVGALLELRGHPPAPGVFGVLGVLEAVGP
jgi:hypothetical protein